jgi:Chaperone of endosialidase
MKTITNIIYPAFPLFAFACFSLSPAAWAIDPPPDGGYPGANTAEGDDALFSLATGVQNTAIGFHTLYANTTGAYNTANGYIALTSNTSGGSNTANGYGALSRNTTGGANTATGVLALYQNTEGIYNTANGVFALGKNTTGGENTANGRFALYGNTTGGGNTATGAYALVGSGTGNTGNQNTATGYLALGSNTTGNNNTATGYQTMCCNTTGNNNTADGPKALFKNTTGNKNTASGLSALFANTIGVENTGIGNAALRGNTTGSFNIAIGSNAGANLTTGSNNIDIGAVGVPGESNTMRIGTVRQTATFIAGISGAVVTGAPVIVNATGQLGTATSSQRFKDDIKPMDKASEAILALKPVTFHYKKEIDADRTPQFGLVAEDVEKVNPDLVVRDENGEIYTVRYEAVNAMLLNEFLKEHRKVQEQEATIMQLKKDLQATTERQQRQIEVLTAGLQNVSAQIELNKSASQTVLNDQ